MNEEISRRPIRTRDTRWAAATAKWLASMGFRPNQISLMSILFGVLSGFAFVLAGWTDDPLKKCLAFLLAAAGIQLRLLCNLFDGMVAVEGGFRTKSGELFNELPDRFADAFILAGSGYSFGSPHWLPELAWSTAVLSVITAYVRALGASMGTGQMFLGPMAKQHRMAVMTTAVVMNSIGIFFTNSSLIIVLALSIIAIGTSITIFRRCRSIIHIAEAQ